MLLADRQANDSQSKRRYPSASLAIILNLTVFTRTTPRGLSRRPSSIRSGVKHRFGRRRPCFHHRVNHLVQRVDPYSQPRRCEHPAPPEYELSSPSRTRPRITRPTFVVRTVTSWLLYIPETAFTEVQTRVSGHLPYRSQQSSARWNHVGILDCLSWISVRRLGHRPHLSRANGTYIRDLSRSSGKPILLAPLKSCPLIRQAFQDPISLLGWGHLTGWSLSHIPYHVSPSRLFSASLFETDIVGIRIIRRI